MANYDTLKATIDAYIRANGVKAITGPVLNGVLRAMVDSVSGGLLFKGIATPAGDPGTPDQNVFFLATDAGTYTNYGGAVLDGKHAAFFVWAGSWTAYLTGIPTDASLPTRVSQLTNDAGYITADSLAAYYTKAETDALLAGKQATLESGTNIKTINGESLLGSGDITIQGGGSEPYFVRGTIDFNQDPPAVTITSGTYAEALAAYNAGTPVYAALTEGNGAVNIYPLAQVISPFLVFIGIGADSVLAVALESDGTVTAVNSALVHPSDLATVATSGDYEDLTNKPTIPAAQVQSDWDEADNTEPSFIRNKPTIPGPEVFWAEYGVTTYADVEAAIEADKFVLCKYNENVYMLNYKTANDYRFYFVAAAYVYELRCTDADVWSSGYQGLQRLSDKVTSWQATPDNTHYPSEKLVKDSIDAVDNVFWATYGTTTASEIQAAIANGKTVFSLYDNALYVLANVSSTYIYLSSLSVGTNTWLRITISSNMWAKGDSALQVTSDRVSTISGNESSTSKYPNTKAAYDAIHPAIATTQPAGGLLPNIFYNLGTLSGNTTFALATPADANVVNHYYWTFDTGSTAPTITWPAGITWMGGSAPTINASKHYEISVLNGIGVYMEV